MKRCNNCGWFNADSALECEKCGEESFELVESPVVVEETHIEETISAAIPETVVEPLVEKVETVVALDVPVENVEPETIDDMSAKPVKNNKFAKATVAIDACIPKCAPKSEPKQGEEPVLSVKNKFAKATVAIGSDMPAVAPKEVTLPKADEVVPEVAHLSEPVKCPKCCYPITGYAEYCPNCGATVKSVNPVEKSEPLHDCKHTKEDVEHHLNATVLETFNDDGCDDREDNGVYRLIPVDVLSEAVIELRLGEIVVIRGERFKFDK